MPRTKLIRLRRKENKKLFAKTDFLVDKILSCPRIKLSNSQIFKMDFMETKVLLPNFAQQLSRKNADVLDVYFTLVYAAGISPTLILNQNAKVKDGRSWIYIKI